MKLNEYELDYVKYFIQVKGNHQYEVLAEIMDHFVLMLEEKKEEYPNTAFEDLVNDVYAVSGKTMFKEINRSTKRRIRKQYNRLFLSHLMVFLRYEYVIGMALVGVFLYHLQSLLQNVANYLVIHTIATILMYFFFFKVSSVIALGNPKFMCNKIIKYYGFYLMLATNLIFRVPIKTVINPTSFGFNMFYLISTIMLIVQAIVLYSMVRTARLIVEESEEIEETYQILK